MFLGFYPAVLISYDAVSRIGEVTIEGLTDGADRGLEATFAYPVGESDLDTELKIDAVALPAPVWVFFEAGDPSVPVISAWRGHQDGTALVDTRRIRQKNIEVLATANITLQAIDTIVIHSENVVINANSSVLINSPMTTIDGKATFTDDVVFGGTVKNNGIDIGSTHKHPAKPPSSPTDFSGTPTP